MDFIPRVSAEEYTYELPPERIAAYPLPERDRCRLLVADCRTGEIRHHIFAELPQLLPKGSLLVRNVTKVVHARLLLRKPTGGLVELLLLHPTTGSPELRLSSPPPVEWECLVRGRRLRTGMDLHIRTENLHLRATLLTLESGHARVQLAWSPEDQTLAEILEQLGHIPLPPYLRRDDEPIDREHYQTVYAQIPGSAAAPTAGLHFTEELLERLQNEGMLFADVCLHVGLDTFKPLRSTDVTAHSMHSESLSVPRHSLEQLRDFLRTQTQQWLVAIGTTSVRTLESLFWHGVRLIRTQSLWESPILELPQWEAYRLMREPLPSPADALDAILAWLDFHRLEQLQGTTQLMIVPGYRYQMCDALITNFHQPRSTLLLLIGALVGDFWRSIYEEALAHGYRFLSYGDASLLICPRNRTGHKSRQ